MRVFMRKSRWVCENGSFISSKSLGRQTVELLLRVELVSVEHKLHHAAESSDVSRAERPSGAFVNVRFDVSVLGCRCVHTLGEKVCRVTHAGDYGAIYRSGSSLLD